MSTLPRSTPTSSGTAPETLKLEGNLRTGHLVLTALAFNAPLGQLAGFVPIVIGLGIGTGTPLVYLVVTVLMLLLAVGMLAMARHMQRPGAFYGYVTAGLGRPAGLGAGFTALTAYVLLTAMTFIAGGVGLNVLIHHQFGGPDIPWWVLSLGQWAVVSAFGLFNVQLSARLLTILLLVELAIAIGWEFAVVGDGGAAGRTFEIANPLVTGSLGFALLWAVNCLTGFESIQVFRDETRNPARTIPRATYLTVVLLGCFYAAASYVFIIALGPDGATAAAAAPAAAFQESLATHLGDVLASFANIVLWTSGVGALLALQSVSARYVFSLSRDGVLPPVLARVSPRSRSPRNAALVTAGTALVFLLVPVVLQLDPVRTYTTYGGFGTWGLITLMALTCLAIVAFFVGRRDLSTSLWRESIAPATALLGLSIILVVAAGARAVLFGGTAAFGTGCIAALTTIGLAGAGFALWLRTRRPVAYQAIGNQSEDDDVVEHVVADLTEGRTPATGRAAADPQAEAPEA